MQNLKAMAFNAEGQADADGVFEFDVPVGITILGVSLCVEAYSGSGSTCNIDVQDDTSDVITAVTADTAGTPGTWYTPCFGGTETPVRVAAGSDVEIDLNLDSDTADFTVIIYFVFGEV